MKTRIKGIFKTTLITLGLTLLIGCGAEPDTPVQYKCREKGCYNTVGDPSEFCSEHADKAIETTTPTPTYGATSSDVDENGYLHIPIPGGGYRLVTPTPAISEKMELAVIKVRDYIDEPGNFYSYPGLVDELTWDGFTEEEISYALEVRNIDWMKQAVRVAENLTAKGSGHSYSNPEHLIRVMEQRGFTPEQARYGVENANIDWDYQAYRYAWRCIEKELRDDNHYGREDYIRLLEERGVRHENAVSAVDKIMQEDRWDYSLHPSYSYDEW